jgi:hypothetical protein
MNGDSKPGKTSSKKGIKNLPGIPDINSIFSRSSNTYGILPQPPPPAPNLPLLGGASIISTKAPVDNTGIIVNGKITDMNSAIENRIEENNTIRPISPAAASSETPRYTREPMTPNFGIPTNVKIIKTPPMPAMNVLPIPSIVEKAESVISDGRSVVTEDARTPETKTETSSEGSRSVSSTPSSGRKTNLKSVLPVYNKPRQQPVVREEEEITAFSPVHIPVPVFSVQPRVVSPIQTIGGPQSPSPAKPIFNPNGKSRTPIKISPPPTVRAKTPPPAFRAQPTQIPYTPQLPFSPHQKSGYGEMFHSLDGLTREQEIYLRQEFKVKFGILRSNYPQWSVIDPPDSLTVKQLNELYERYVRQILVSKETGQYKVYMVIFLMVIEVIGVKFLKLNMSGYTMSQLKIINRYDALFIELGEKWLVSGSSNWPVEARIIMMMMFNAVIFLVVRYLCSWMGADGLADTLQGLIDSMLNGPAVFSASNSVPSGGGPASSVSEPAPLGAGPVPTENSGGGNVVDNIANAFGSFFSNNAGNIGEKIAQIGTVFSNKLQNNNKTQPAKSNPPPPAQVKKINKKKLFED